jgi:hypothetical protein
MASKAEYLKKRKVRKLSDMINRKFDPGQGNPKTVNPNKKKSVVPRKPDYLSEAVQKLAYKFGLTDQPSAQSVREETYKAKPEAKILGSVKSVDKPTGKKRYSSPIGPRKPKYDSPIGPRKPEATAITAGPGRMGSQTVTGPKKKDFTGSGNGGARDSGRVGGGLSGSGVTRPSATATAGTGTSTGAAEKMTNFERMKARQYEREGYGGRVMTRKKATEQVMKERQYKSPLAGLFKRKGN